MNALILWLEKATFFSFGVAAVGAVLEAALWVAGQIAGLDSLPSRLSVLAVSALLVLSGVGIFRRGIYGSR